VEFAGDDEDEEGVKEDYEKTEGFAVVDGEEINWQGWLKVDMRQLYDTWFSIAAGTVMACMWEEAMEENNGVYYRE
jgi:hypothetical protein